MFYVSCLALVVVGALGDSLSALRELHTSVVVSRGNGELPAGGVVDLQGDLAIEASVDNLGVSRA